MFWVIQVSIASLVIIFVLHHLYAFFKDTLTVPKIKDMVKRPQQKYETLFRELRNNRDNRDNETSDDATNAMKTELKRYLMDLNSMQQPSQQSQQSQQQSHPQPHPQPQSNFIEMGSMFN